MTVGPVAAGSQAASRWNYPDAAVNSDVLRLGFATAALWGAVFTLLQ